MSTTAIATALHSSSFMAVLLLAAILITLGSAESAKESPPSACANELVQFSPCLPYVASPPNNLSNSPPSKCCDAFSPAVESGRAVCLCYLIQHPTMLGFPVSVTRVLSLSSVCSLRNSTSGSTSLESLCSESPELAPLRKSAPGPTASSPRMVTTLEPTNSSSTQPILTPPSSAAIVSSSAMKRIFKNTSLVSTCHIDFHTHLIIYIQPG